MPNDPFNEYIDDINRAYLRGDATEHTHRPALKALIEALGNKITATNEPRRQKCGAPDYIVSRRKKGLDQNIGYVEAKDIGINLTQVAKSEQIKKRYLPSLNNFILTDYIEFRWYVNGQKQLTARLAEESAGKFKIIGEGQEKVGQLLKSFLSQKPEKIKIARELAAKMAHKAQMMRDIIRETFQQESETGTLHGQFEAFKEVLLHDLTEEQFADMYAQTISYGLFTARCYIDDMTIFGKDKYAAFHGIDEKAKELTREHAAYLLPKTNPFLRKMFNHIAGPDLDSRIAWLVDDLVELLRQADMGTILKDFAKQTKRKDPVIHFYETFLAEYDAKLRKSRGVYYTPEPVVSYIVRSVDYLLKTRFGLKRGLADEKKIKIKTQDGQSKEVHKCLILDPAVGTGTFLHEVVNQIHDKFKRQRGMWSGYVKDHLLPRIFGFELMMAPYAVAHMKLGLQLADTSYDFDSEERLGIYLTNTLEEANEISKNVFVQELSNEAMAANNIKKDLPIMVVLGNPPYSNFSRMNRDRWILDLLEDYKKGLREKKLNLDDDFIKFIKYGQHRIEQTGSGILAFITNNTYIDGITRRRMRHSLMETFSDIYIIDLHGSLKKTETCPDGSKDENVFDIQQGVAIGIFVKESDKTGLAKIHHANLYGLREGKYEWLIENNVKTTKWTEVNPKPEHYFFVPKDLSLEKEYLTYWTVTDIFSVNQNGLKTDRDTLFFDFDREELKKRIQTFYTETALKPPFAENYRVLNSSSYDLLSRRLQTTFDSANIYPCLYRPFDKRWLYYSTKLTSRPADQVMCHILAGNNVALIACRQFAGYQYFTVNCTNNLTEISSQPYAPLNLFPLYLYPNVKQSNLFEHSVWPSGKNGRVPNLSVDFVEQFTEKIGMVFVSDGPGDLKKTFGPEDIFHYIYAVFHSPEYRRRYAEFLKIDFPRVPMSKGKPLFRKLCNVGEQLVKLHLLEAEILEEQNKWPDFNIEGSDSVEKGYPKYVAHADRPQKGKVYINQDQYFEGITPEVWGFHIGGYQVCEKWLKDRRDRKLDYEDICHYQKITISLGETITLMDQVDKVIDSNGGWPIK